MSNKPSGMKVKKQVQEQVNPITQVYRPGTKVEISAEFMNSILQGVLGLREQRLVDVMDLNGKPVGFGLHPNDRDVDALWRFVLDAHTKNINDGVTVDVNVLKQEFEVQQSKPKLVTE